MRLHVFALYCAKGRNHRETNVGKLAHATISQRVARHRFEFKKQVCNIERHYRKNCQKLKIKNITKTLSLQKVFVAATFISFYFNHSD